jgi:hypothetical protein
MHIKFNPGVFCFFGVFSLFVCGVAVAQDVQTGVMFVCNGERLEIESCNMQNVSDTSSCLVAHPDRPLHNGFTAYTNETRGNLKKLLPTCQQPSAAAVARAQAFAKKQNDTQDAALKKNLALMDAPPRGPAGPASAQDAKSQRDKVRLARCLSTGRSQGQCAGSEFGKAFEGVFAFAGSMLGVAPPEPGIYLNGIYEGKGGWNIGFAPDNAAMQCSDLVTSGHPYKIEFKGTQVSVKVENKPDPLVLTYRDNKLYGPAPVQVAGNIVVGHTNGSGGGDYGSSSSGSSMPQSHTETTTREIGSLEADAYVRSGGSGGNLQQSGPGYTLSETTTTTDYSSHPAPAAPIYSGPTVITAPRTRTCPAPALVTTKNAPSQDMGNALSGLAGMFGMDDEGKKSAPAPTGLRMFGEFAGPGSADIDFHDDAAIVACGEIAAEYPYAIDLSGSQPVLRLASAGKPSISLTFGPDRTLVGSGQLQITGRFVSGADRDGNISYGQRSISCPLGTLTPVSEKSSNDEFQPASILSGALGSASAPTSSRGASTNGATASSATSTASATTASPNLAKGNPAAPAFAKPSAPTGNAVLSIASGFPSQVGVSNPLAGRPYLLLRDDVGVVLAKSGVPVPAGVPPQEAVMSACEKQKPECQKYLAAISADAATGLRSDADGKATLPGVPPGTYYMTASTKIGNLNLYWNVKVNLKAGQNSLVVDQHNAAPVK